MLGCCLQAKYTVTTHLFHPVVALQTVDLCILITEKRTMLGFNEEYSLQNEESNSVPLTYALTFAVAVSLIVSFPISTCTRKRVLMKSLILCLVQLRTCSFTASFVHSFSFPPLFLHSSFIDPTIVGQLCVNNIYSALRETKNTWTKGPYWWGSEAPNLFTASALLFLTFATI